MPYPGYQPIHKREPRIPDGWIVTKYERPNGEEAVNIVFGTPFDFGNNGPYSTGKQIASQLLRKNYDRIRVVDVTYDRQAEKVVALSYAFR